MASTGPNKTEGTSLAGSHVRGPVHWFSIAIRKDITRPTLSNPNAAPANLLTRPSATSSSVFSSSFASKWTPTTTIKNVIANAAM